MVLQYSVMINPTAAQDSDYVYKVNASSYAAAAIKGMELYKREITGDRLISMNRNVLKGHGLFKDTTTKALRKAGIRRFVAGRRSFAIRARVIRWD